MQKLKVSHGATESANESNEFAAAVRTFHVISGDCRTSPVVNVLRPMLTVEAPNNAKIGV